MKGLLRQEPLVLLSVLNPEMWHALKRKGPCGSWKPYTLTGRGAYSAPFLLPSLRGSTEELSRLPFAAHGPVGDTGTLPSRENPLSGESPLSRGELTSVVRSGPGRKSPPIKEEMMAT